jgi:hypothetical protein
MNMEKSIDPAFWDDRNKQWDSHSAFKTVNHWHVSDYGDDANAEVLIVKCADGRFYIEDNFGDAAGSANVFEPKVKESYPVFFHKFADVNKAAAKVVASITGSNFQSLMVEEH